MIAWLYRLFGLIPHVCQFEIDQDTPRWRYYYREEGRYANCKCGAVAKIGLGYVQRGG